jgi:alpha-tubulin suppressor-like RCC1 family protein
MVRPVANSRAGAVLLIAAVASATLGIGPMARTASAATLPQACTTPLAQGHDAMFTTAVTFDGSVISWGLNTGGELGQGTIATTAPFITLSAAQVVGPTGQGALGGIVSVASGSFHTLALNSTGAVFTWGDDFFGQLGDGRQGSEPSGQNKLSAVPVQVLGPGGQGFLTGVVYVAAGLNNSAAVRSDGTVWAWGYPYGSIPVQITGFTAPVVQIAVGALHYVALQSDGTVWTWGSNSNGQLGNGTTVNSAVPVEVLTAVGGPPLTNVVKIAAGQYDSYSLDAQGVPMSWGANFSGQLGDGLAPNDSSLPVETNLPPAAFPVKGIRAGTDTAFAWGASSAYGWGNDSNDQLGNGTDASSGGPQFFDNPVQVLSPPVLDIAADGTTTSALYADGTLRGWGNVNVGDSVQFVNFSPPIQLRPNGIATPTCLTPTNPLLRYVALGDSYSSGEGDPPFEDGVNYPAAVHQENTYTYGPNHNDCHRALTNYAKLTAPNLAPGTSTLLVDRTCSGALIVPPAGSLKGPIVPTSSTFGRTDDQVTQALTRLNNDFGGLKASDVNVVSVTMGGNDAGFGDLIQACLLPNIIRQLVTTYPNTPPDIAFVDWVASHFGTCKLIDDNQYHTAQKIAALPGLEQQAQASATTVFPNARVLQLTYPDFVPQQSDFAGNSCGGMLRADSNYARTKAQQIDGAIRSAGTITTSQSNRFQIVDLENQFGLNGLCPADPSKALVNGISPTALRSVIGGLSAPGTQSRVLLDNLANAYNNFRNCVLSIPFSGPGAPVVALFCKFQYDALVAAANALRAYFTPDRISALVGDLAGGTTPEIRFDNSRLLFHPNAAGWRVMSCNLTAAYRGVSAASCLPSQGAALLYQFNGVSLNTTAPQVVTPGIPIPFQFNGFDPGSAVSITAFSSALDLGTVPVSASGVVSGSFTIPPGLNPGIHRVVFQGTNGGSPRTIEVLVQLNGRPRGGEDYGLYFGGFTQDNAVDITYGGLDYGLQTPDDNGGVFVEVPVPIASLPASISVVATGVTSQTVVTQTVTPAPHNAAVWAGGGSSSGVTVSGSGIQISGWVHSDGSVTVNGHGIKLTGGVEYGTSATVTGSGTTVSPSPVQVSPGGEPLTVNIADWRPGGARATQLGGGYQAVPPSACTSGVWHPHAGDIQGSVVYVPCSVEIAGIGPIASSIIAEGTIIVDGNGIQLSGTAANFSLASGATDASAIVISGNGFSAARPLWAAGGINLAGHGEQLSCGVYGASVSATASGTKIDACDPGT